MSRKTRLVKDMKLRMTDAATCERDTVRIRHDQPVRVHLDPVTNRVTRRSYKACTVQFCDYCVNKKIYWADIKSMQEADRVQLIEEYEVELASKAYTAATIHTKLAPVCRALDVDMGLISKPIRRTGDIVRGVEEDANAKGRRELENPRYQRLVEFQKRVGIRRSELQHLRGCDFVDNSDKGGACYVIVRRGKGGKRQFQWIAPRDIDFVRSYFDGSDSPVFSKGEIPPHADLHSLRAQHAQEVYKLWAGYLEKRPGARSKLSKALIGYAEKYGAPNNVDAVRRELAKPAEYKLRGDSKRLAEMYGMPTTLDRTAIMATSILSLAHWRANVTVSNYLLKPPVS